MEDAADVDRRSRGMIIPRMPGARGAQGRNKVKASWEDLTKDDLLAILRWKRKLPAFTHLKLTLVGNVADLRTRVISLGQSFDDCWPIAAMEDDGDVVAARNDGGALGEGEDQKEEQDDQNRMEIDEDHRPQQQPADIEGNNAVGDETIEYDSEHEEHEDTPFPAEEAVEQEEVALVEEEAIGRRARHRMVKYSEDDYVPCSCGCHHQYPYQEMTLCVGCGRGTGKLVRRRCVSNTWKCDACRTPK